MATSGAVDDRALKHSQALHYDTLPETGYFRLLKLHPGSDSDAIKADLLVRSIDQAADTYEAISYVWGDPNITEQVCCNQTWMSVTVNLADALRTFRSLSSTTLVWADAVCINQRDLDERASQVKQMDKVYINARRVITWLGRDPDGIAGDCFQLIVETNTIFDDEYLRSNAPPWDQPRLTEPYKISTDGAQWAKVSTLLQKPWFERVWVVQEVGLAKECTLHWGAHKIDVAHIFEFAHWHGWKASFASIPGILALRLRTGRLFQMYVDVHARYANVTSWRDTLPLIKFQGSRKRKGSFPDVLMVGNQLKATDARDHIYAFLGNPYARDKDGQPIVGVDYKKPVDGVFLEVTCAMLQHSSSAPWVLSCLEHNDVQQLRERTAPSWVPQWGQPETLPTLASPNYWYCAGGPSDTFTASIRDTKFLEVQGCVFDEVAWLSKVILAWNARVDTQLWDNETRSANMPLIDTLWQDLGKVLTVSEDAFTTTLSKERPANRPKIVNTQQNLEEYNTYCSHVRAACSSAPSQESSASFDGSCSPHDFEWSLLYCHGRRLMVTKNGRLGISPGLAAEVGDVCCVLPGASVPFVLKPSGQGVYKLVGDCYLHGVMDGQIIEELQGGRCKLEMIVIE
ncbi:HET-domain-containing protein [Plenodomus tracheiphilus IPT5]|uniref:HET-domain-containing protein n=1 Tax=Plenodomus tracheiphilus IPT5 TaxID=1408161 RepID=A0A6A7BDE1_9PLEO|nr:HET-domain-containing protein [Plenodomus tracheiphilus IPT5]